VLDAEVLVAHRVGPVLGVEHDLIQRRIGHQLTGSGSLGKSAQLAVGHLTHAADVDPDLLEDRHRNALVVTEHRAEQVQRRKNRMRPGYRDLLGGGQGLLSFQREFVEFHFQTSLESFVPIGDIRPQSRYGANHVPESLSCCK